MPYPLDDILLDLLSTFDGKPRSHPDQYDAASTCLGRQYSFETSDGALNVAEWIHSETAWVSLQGLLSWQAVRALAGVLGHLAVLRVVFHVAELELSPADGGAPLVALCAELSSTGFCVTVVGGEADPVPVTAQPERLATAGA